MKQVSGEIIHRRREVKKMTEADFSNNEISLEKSNGCLQNERPLEPNGDDMIKESENLELLKNAVAIPSSKDILCGRGKSFFNHEGNKRFRYIVGKNVDAYIKASQRPKRSEVVTAVITETLGTGARFLKKSENKLWYDGGMKVAKDKVRYIG
jgi:hypothetical protein